MILRQILAGLRDLPDGAVAETAARLGFLEWVLTLPPDCPVPAAARAALRRVAPQDGRNRAVGLFLDHLSAAQAFDGAAAAPVRRGGASGRRAARLH